MALRHFYLSVVIFPDPYSQETWIVQALERDIAASGPSVEQAKQAFEKTIAGYLQMAPENADEPLSGLKRAPMEFWDIWEQMAAARMPTTERMPSVSAFMIPVVTYEALPARH